MDIKDHFELNNDNFGFIPFSWEGAQFGRFLLNFCYYVITAHAIGHDVIGKPDISKGTLWPILCGTETLLELYALV